MGLFRSKSKIPPENRPDQIENRTIKPSDLLTKQVDSIFFESIAPGIIQGHLANNSSSVNKSSLPDSELTEFAKLHMAAVNKSLSHILPKTRDRSDLQRLLSDSQKLRGLIQNQADQIGTSEEVFGLKICETVLESVITSLNKFADEAISDISTLPKNHPISKSELEYWNAILLAEFYVELYGTAYLKEVLLNLGGELPQMREESIRTELKNLWKLDSSNFEYLRKSLVLDIEIRTQKFKNGEGPFEVKLKSDTARNHYVELNFERNRRIEQMKRQISGGTWFDKSAVNIVEILRSQDEIENSNRPTVVLPPRIVSRLQFYSDINYELTQCVGVLVYSSEQRLSLFTGKVRVGKFGITVGGYNLSFSDFDSAISICNDVEELREITKPFESEFLRIRIDNELSDIFIRFSSQLELIDFFNILVEKTGGTVPESFWLNSDSQPQNIEVVSGEFEFPQNLVPPQILESNSRGNLEESYFLNLQIEDRMGLMRTLPRTIALAQGPLLSQYHLASGPPRFGWHGLAVGDIRSGPFSIKEAIHNPRLKDYVMRVFPELFGDYSSDFLEIKFGFSQVSSLSSLIIGFQKSEDLLDFAVKWEDRYGTKVDIKY